MKSEPIIQLFFIVFLVGFLLPPPVSYIENFSIVAEEEFLITDFEYKFPQRKIVWVNPEELVPHEYTSSEHLEKLCAYLRTLQTTTLLPVPVVTSSHPRVILDGHHRVAASIKLGITRIPVWIVEVGDDTPTRTNEILRSFEEDLLHEENQTSIRCYSRLDDSRIRIKDVARSARTGKIGYGVKGTRHVAVVSRDGQEVKLVRVCPRIEWGTWASSGRINATDLLALDDHDQQQLQTNGNNNSNNSLRPNIW